MKMKDTHWWAIVNISDAEPEAVYYGKQEAQDILDRYYSTKYWRIRRVLITEVKKK